MQKHIMQGLTHPIRLPSDECYLMELLAVHRAWTYLWQHQESTNSDKKPLFLQCFYLERLRRAGERLQEQMGSKGEAWGAPPEEGDMAAAPQLKYKLR